MSKRTNLCIAVLCAGLLLSTGVIAQEEPSIDTVSDHRSVPLKAIPKAVANPDPRIRESITISSDQLNGFAMADLEEVAAQRVATMAGATMAATGADPAQDGYGHYRIGTGDTLEFVSFDDESLNREVIVRFDGHVSLPRIDDMNVEGLTRPEAEEAIRTAYGEIYRDPDISLTITGTDSKSYVVTGDVQTPGRYPYTRSTTLWDAIGVAGGLRLRNSGNGGFIGITGQITKAFVIRRTDGERIVNAYDMRGLGQSGAYEGDVPVYYGDVIYVPEGVNLVYVLGEAQSSIIVELTQGMTLLQMLALSGGFDTSTARLRDVVLLREVDEDNTDVLLIDLRAILKNKAKDITLHPGDVVYLPRKRILRLQEFVQRFTGTMSPIFGLYSQAIDSIFKYSISRETLDALERGNNVSVGTGARGVTRAPRVINVPAAP